MFRHKPDSLFEAYIKMHEASLLPGQDMEPEDGFGGPPDASPKKDIPSPLRPDVANQPESPGWAPKGWRFIQQVNVGGVVIYVFIDESGRIYYVSDNDGDGYPDYYQRPGETWRNWDLAPFGN